MNAPFALPAQAAGTHDADYSDRWAPRLCETPFERKPFVVSPALYEALIDKTPSARRLDLQLAVQAHEYAEHKREWIATVGYHGVIGGSLSSPRERHFARRMDAELPRLVDAAERQLRSMVPPEAGARHPMTVVMMPGSAAHG